MKKIPATALVVSCNEADLLARCLPSLAFCDELIVVSLESTDDTKGVAREHGATVVTHERVTHVEMMLEWAVSLARNKWIVSIDPDERIDPTLAVQMAESMEKAETTNTAVLELPWQFYFGERPLKGTYWGGVNHKKGTFFHRDRVKFSQLIHHRPLPKEGFVSQLISWEGSNVLHHYWMKNFSQLMEKHLRYLPAEGERRAKSGIKFSWWKMAGQTGHAFVWSLVKKQSYRDGLLGVALSGFYAWYVAAVWWALRRFESHSTVLVPSKNKPSTPLLP